MAGGWRPDDIPEARVPEVARRMLRAFATMYDTIERRRQHLNTEVEADPPLVEPQGDSPAANDLMSQASRFQSRELAIVAKKLIDRICENPWQVECKAPDETAALEKISNNIAQIDNAWGLDIEDRMEMRVQRRLAQHCVTDKGYSILHVRRCEDLWPEIEWSAKEGAGQLSQEERQEECYGCMGEGGDEDGECPQCGGTGMVARAKLTFRGKSGYRDAAYRTYADAGAPWTWEVVDPLNFAWEEDRDPRGGIARALYHFEVSIDDYLDAQDRARVKVEDVRRAFALPGSRHGEFYAETPQSQDLEGQRATVYQLWTRSHLYEWIEGGDGNGAPNGGWLVKGGPHGYPRIPFRIVAPRHTGAADLIRRYVCDLDDMYAIKPWADRQVSFMGGIMENTMQPLYQTSMDESKTPLLPLADGTPQGQGALAPGAKVEVISAPLPQAVATFWQELKELLERSKPDTGDVDVSATSQAWAIRLGQAQAGKGPRAHIAEHSAALSWAWNLIHDWHTEHEEPMVAYGRDMESRQPVGNKPIVVEPYQIQHHRAWVYINAVSAAEQQMEEEFHRGLLAEQLITPEDFYKVRGERDPHDAYLRVASFWIGQPYIAESIKGKLAERMGAQFLIGPGGQLMNGAGQPVQPEQVLAQNGWTPAGAGVPPGAEQPGTGGAPPMGGNMLGQIRGQAQMPSLPALASPTAGVPAMPGLPG